MISLEYQNFTLKDVFPVFKKEDFQSCFPWLPQKLPENIALDSKCGCPTFSMHPEHSYYMRTV